VTTVVVTGASAGVGRATARAFAREGASVALLARDRDGLEVAAKDVEAEGGTSMVFPLDVADADAVEAAANLIEVELGPIAVWVNNAMVSVCSHPYTSSRPTRCGASPTSRISARCTEPCRRCAACGRVITARSCKSAQRSIPLQAAYCGAKHAIDGFTDSLRCELRHDHSGVRVTAVQLPALNTPQFEWVRSRRQRRDACPRGLSFIGV
jgi:short-subunit dehydrogenase